MRLILSITGASGVIYGIRLLEELACHGVEVHLVVSSAAKTIIGQETYYSVEQVCEMAYCYYEENDFTAPIASGSFLTGGMVVAPCSMKTLAGIAAGYSANLAMRAADTTIKERRRLILVPRETPLSPVHLENMLKLGRLGVTIMPPVPAFYTKPATLDDVINFTAGRVMDHLEIPHSLTPRWGEN